MTAIIPTGDGPISLAASADAIWLELHREDRVQRIDPAANRPVETPDVLVHCSLATTANRLWTAHPRPGTVSQVDLASGEILLQYSVPVACGVLTDGVETWVTSPDTGEVTVFVDDVAESIDSFPVGDMIFGGAMDERGGWIHGEADGGTVWRVDRATHEASSVGQFRGVDGVSLAFDAVWLTSRSTGHLWKLDPATGSVTAEMRIDAPRGVVAAEDTLWVISEGGAVSFGGTLTGLDPETLEEVASEALPYSFLGPPIYAFDSLWTASLENNVLLRVDLTGL